MNIIFWIVTIIFIIFITFFLFILIGVRIEKIRKKKQMFKDLDEFYKNNKKYF